MIKCAHKNKNHPIIATQLDQATVEKYQSSPILQIASVTWSKVSTTNRSWSLVPDFIRSTNLFFLLCNSKVENIKKLSYVLCKNWKVSSLLMIVVLTWWLIIIIILLQDQALHAPPSRRDMTNKKVQSLGEIKVDIAGSFIDTPMKMQMLMKQYNKWNKGSGLIQALSHVSVGLKNVWVKWLIFWIGAKVFGIVWKE